MSTDKLGIKVKQERKEQKIVFGVVCNFWKWVEVKKKNTTYFFRVFPKTHVMTVPVWGRGAKIHFNKQRKMNLYITFLILTQIFQYLYISNKAMLYKFKSVPPYISIIINNFKVPYIIPCSISYKEEQQKPKLKTKSHNSQCERVLILKVGLMKC